MVRSLLNMDNDKKVYDDDDFIDIQKEIDQILRIEQQRKKSKNIIKIGQSKSDNLLLKSK